MSFLEHLDMRDTTNIRLSMLRDMKLFKAKLEHVDGFGDTGDYLVGIINSKQVKSASPPPSETKGEDKAAAEDTSEAKDTERSSEEKKPAQAGFDGATRSQ